MGKVRDEHIASNVSSKANQVGQLDGSDWKRFPSVTRTNVGKAREWIPSLIFVGVNLPRVHHQVDAFVGSGGSGLIAKSSSTDVDVGLVVVTQT